MMVRVPTRTDAPLAAMPFICMFHRSRRRKPSTRTRSAVEHNAKVVVAGAAADPRRRRARFKANLMLDLCSSRPINISSDKSVSWHSRSRGVSRELTPTPPRNSLRVAGGLRRRGGGPGRRSRSRRAADGGDGAERRVRREPERRGRERGRKPEGSGKGVPASRPRTPASDDSDICTRRKYGIGGRCARQSARGRASCVVARAPATRAAAGAPDSPALRTPGVAWRLYAVWRRRATRAQP